MLRTASSLPHTGLSTLGSGPARFQTRPPACYRAPWQLPGPDFHRQATTSLRNRPSTTHMINHLSLLDAQEATAMTKAIGGLLAAVLAVIFTCAAGLTLVFGGPATGCTAPALGTDAAAAAISP